MVTTDVPEKEYFIQMDGQIYGPFQYSDVINLGILPDTLICTSETTARWQTAMSYPEFSCVFNTDSEEYANDGFDTDSEDYSMEDSDYDTEDYHYDYSDDTTSIVQNTSPIDEEKLLFYQQKRKAALIGVLTLGLAGLAIVGVGNTWRGNIFSGTSMDHGGIGFVLKILSFCFLSLLVAVPFFIISFIQLIYYSAKINSVS